MYEPSKIVFTPKSLSVDVINITGGTQSRLKIKEDYVEEIYEKMKDGVLCSTDVKIHSTTAHPIFFCGRAPSDPIVVGVAKPQIVPAGTCPLGHGIDLTGKSIRQISPRFCFR